MYTPGGCRGGRSDFKADSGRVYRAELGPPLAERRRAFRILFYPPGLSSDTATTVLYIYLLVTIGRAFVLDQG